MARERAKQPFAAIPFAVFAAREAGALTDTAYAILVWLTYRCRRDISTGGATTFTVSQLKAEARLTVTGQTIINSIRSLAPTWISVVEPPKGGSRWTVSLTGADITSDITSDLPNLQTLPDAPDQNQDDLQNDVVVDLEVSSNAWNSPETATPDDNSDSGAHEPPNVAPPLEVEVEEEKALAEEEQETSKSAEPAIRGLARASLDGGTADVLDVAIPQEALAFLRERGLLRVEGR